MSDNPNECGALGPESCWELTDNVWVYTTSHGNTKTGTLPGSEVTAQLVTVSDTECLLQLFVNKVQSDEVNLFPLLEKIVIPEIPPTTVDTGLDADCVLTTTVDGVSDTADLTPLLDKIVFPEPFELPPTTVATSFNSETCDFTTTVDGVTSVTNIADILSSLCIEFEGQELVLKHKAGECRVTLPKHVVDVDINVAACTQIVTYSDGTTETQPYLDAVTLEKNAEGVGLLTIKGVTCPIHPPVVIPADVRITGIDIVAGPGDGEYNVVVQVSDGTTLNAGPIIDTDTWTIVTDNGDGTGTVTAPDNSTCTFVKGVQSKVVPSADGKTALMTQNDGSTCVVFKELPDSFCIQYRGNDGVWVDTPPAFVCETRMVNKSTGDVTHAWCNPARAKYAHVKLLGGDLGATLYAAPDPRGVGPQRILIGPEVPVNLDCDEKIRVTVNHSMSTRFNAPEVNIITFRDDLQLNGAIVEIGAQVAGATYSDVPATQFNDEHVTETFCVDVPAGNNMLGLNVVIIGLQGTIPMGGTDIFDHWLITEPTIDWEVIK